MINSNLNVSKIVATPTENSWAQAYNAGSLFAVLSLAKISEENEEDLSLIGKEVLNTLEEEYYTLEEKNLESIKKAFSLTSKKIPDSLLSSFLASSIVNNVLYILSIGKNRIILKRGEKIGSILESFEDSSENKEINTVSLSGFLEDKDIIFFSTEDFSKIIKNEELLSALAYETPSDIAETLSPKVHEQKLGGASAIVILYKNPNELSQQDESLEKEEQIDKNEEILQVKEEKITERKKAKIPSLPFKLDIRNLINFQQFNLGHSKKVLLTISIVLISILIFSIVFANKKQEESKINKIFKETYKQAKAKFDEGNALLTLNKNLAREDLLSAQKILNDNKSKFKPESEEEKQTLSLLSEIQEKLSQTEQKNSVSAKEVDSGKSKLLDYEAKNTDSIAFSQDEKNIYFAKAKSDLAKENEVFSLDKSSDNKKSIIKDDSISDISGLGAYNGNIYVLDKKSKILKFAASDSGFGKSDYLKEDSSIDFSLANAMSIDGSIWVLMSDGTIYKFTKGKRESFKVSGIDTPFIKPTKIFTDKEMDNVYILDNGNSRIVVLNKDGAYQAQYGANIIGNAKDFEVLEKDKKIYLLSENKIFEIELK